MISYETKRPRQKKKKQEVDATSPLNKSLKSLSGLPTKGCEHRDPVSSVTDCFTASFSAHGLAMSKLKEGEEAEDNSLAGEGEKQNKADEEAEGKPWSELQLGEKKEEQPTGGMEANYQQTKLQKQSGRFIHKFADITFGRGNIAAGILQGEGKILLVSSMKQAVGQAPPTNQRQQKLWGDSSVQREVPSDDSKIIFNEGDVNTAVGIVIDSINSGRNALENLSRIVTEGSIGSGEEAQALEQMYPFLSTRRERALIETYQERLSAMESDEAGAPERASLEYGLKKTQAILQKKQAMCARFAAVSDVMAGRAKTAEEEFSEAAFPAALFQTLLEFADFGGEGGEGGAAGAGAGTGEPGGEPPDGDAPPDGDTPPDGAKKDGEAVIPAAGGREQGEQPAPSGQEGAAQ